MGEKSIFVRHEQTILSKKGGVPALSWRLLDLDLAEIRNQVHPQTEGRTQV